MAFHSIGPLLTNPQHEEDERTRAADPCASPAVALLYERVLVIRCAAPRNSRGTRWGTHMLMNNCYKDAQAKRVGVGGTIAGGKALLVLR